MDARTSEVRDIIATMNFDQHTTARPLRIGVTLGEIKQW
jgi:hypothetical protein